MPTPSPIMLADLRREAGDRRSGSAMSDIELIPSARPKSAIPIGRPIAITEPNATSRITIAATRPISSLIPTSDSSKAKNRSPPSSIWSGEPVALPGDERLQAVEVGAAEVLEDRILDADDGHAAVGRDLAAGVEHVRQGGRAGLELGQARRRAAVASGGARRDDHLRGEARPLRAGRAEHRRGPARSRPRARRTCPRDRGRSPPRRRPRARRRRATHRRWRMGGGPRGGRGDRGRRTWRRSSRRAAAVNIGRWDTLGSAFRPMRGRHFRPMARPAPPVYGGYVSSAVQLVPGRAPGSRSARPGLAGLGAAGGDRGRRGPRDRSSATDLIWRPAGLVVCVGLAVALLWRRTHPLLVTVIAFGGHLAARYGASVAVGADEPMAILVHAPRTCSAPVRAVPLGLGTRRGDRDGVHPRPSTSSRRSSPAPSPT